MRRAWIGLLAPATIFMVEKIVLLRGRAATAQSPSMDSGGSGFAKHPLRLSPEDLEIGGDLAGFVIARQNCLRCQNMANEGGLKAGVSWTMLATLATAAPDIFAAYVRNPQAKNPRAQMPASPDYDDATIAALRAYFQTFPPQNKP